MIINPYRFGAAAPTGTRWWRIKITACETSTTGTSAAEITMATSHGGTNLATGGTAFASSSFDGTTFPANAFDGSAGSIWASASVGQPWNIGYHLPSAAVINSVAVTTRSDGGTYGQGFMDFSIQSSADTTTGEDGIWTDEWFVTGQTAWSASETRAFDR